MAEEEEKKEEETHRTVGKKIVEILERRGMPTVLAIALVCALYGILVALGVITVTQCTASYTQTADGDVHVQGTVAAPKDVTK